MSSSIMHVSSKSTFPLQMTVLYCISPIFFALLFKPVVSFLSHYKNRRPHMELRCPFYLQTCVCLGLTLFSVLLQKRKCPHSVKGKSLTGTLIVFFSVVLKKSSPGYFLCLQYFISIQTCFAFFILAALFFSLPTSSSSSESIFVQDFSTHPFLIFMNSLDTLTLTERKPTARVH